MSIKYNTEINYNNKSHIQQKKKNLNKTEILHV